MDMTTFYGSIDSVLIRTGVKPDDLGFEADDSPGDEDVDDFGDFIEGLLVEASDLMDRVMHTSYLDESDIPPGLDGIANDCVSDALRRMVQSRQTPVVRIDDFAVQVVQSVVLSKDIIRRLKLYASGGGVRSVEIQQDSLANLPTTFTAAQLNTIDQDA
jgi:hypothetical protein